MGANDNDIICFGRYEGWMRWLARGMKDGDRDCLWKAARLFAAMLPEECYVVPMPSHTGSATYMAHVGMFVSNGLRRYLNCLSCPPHESSYAVKKDGAEPEDLEMVANIGDGWRPSMPIFILDNVVCTNTTARAAINAFKAKGIDAKVFAIASAKWRKI